MNMKIHILAALREKFQDWDTLLAEVSEQQVTVPRFDLDWSIKDVVTHLWAWQQISIAHMEAVLHNREPEFPSWIVEAVGNWEENANQVNAVTFERNHDKVWSEIYGTWRTGFLRLLEAGKRISERDLLDGGKHPWLKGYSLAFILVASYDHHQEHLEKLLAALNR